MSKDLKTPTPTDENGGWTSQAVMEMLERQSAKEDAEHEAFQTTLGEPDLVLTHFSGAEMGLFRVKGGVFMIERRKNGFHWHERRAFTENEIHALSEVAALPVVRENRPAQP